MARMVKSVLLDQLANLAKQDDQVLKDHVVNPDKVAKVSQDLKALLDNPVVTENEDNLAETANEDETVHQDEMVKMAQTGLPANQVNLVQTVFLAKTFKLPMADQVLKDQLAFPDFLDCPERTGSTVLMA